MSYLIDTIFITGIKTHRVKGYIVFEEKYLTIRRKRLRPHKVYIRILDQDHYSICLAMSVCPFVRLSVQVTFIKIVGT